MLAAEFFQQALRLPINGTLELLWLGLGILVVSAALWLSGRYEGGYAAPVDGDRPGA